MKNLKTNQYFILLRDKKIFEGKNVTIFGGGDSALDWAMELSKECNINLIHRRDGFSGAEASVEKVKDLAKFRKNKSFY